jgi:hypothetical protein
MAYEEEDTCVLLMCCQWRRTAGPQGRDARREAHETQGERRKRRKERGGHDGPRLHKEETEGEKRGGRDTRRDLLERPVALDVLGAIGIRQDRAHALVVVRNDEVDPEVRASHSIA